MRRRVVRTIVVGAMAALVTTAAGDVSARSEVVHRPIAVLHANQSANWSGYDQGLLERGTTFHEVSATWVVPTATQHLAGQEEHSATWVGIGGGCIDASCLLTDPTLIQAGTEQDVDAGGRASYYAWWEIIPLPSVTVPLAVAPGQTVRVEVAESFVPELWQISIRNLSTGTGWSTLVPYPSTYATAEWIVETPVVLGAGGVGTATLPSLSTVVFDGATVNHGPAGLRPSEALQLASGGQVEATPSTPDAEGDGFADCSYATSCPVPPS